MKPTNMVSNFVKALGAFEYELSVTDHVWHVLFPDHRRKWHHLHVLKYQNTFFITNALTGESLEVGPHNVVRAVNQMGAVSHTLENDGQLAAQWADLMSAACKWLNTASKNWIKANKCIQAEYPLNQRFGIVPHALIRASLPAIYRLDKALGKVKTRKMVRLVEDGFFLREKNTEINSMTAETYFQYCKIAYIAAKNKKEHIDEALSGRQLYKRYADGRHEGLLDINPASTQEFADWIDGNHPKRAHGGHPWEIKRGGNTTHIDLSVSRPPYRKEGFRVQLRGESMGRMLETIRMFLAIHAAGLPISIADPEGVRMRLLAQDNIGIIPSYAPLHRANQHYQKDDDVYDVLYYDDLGRFKRRITPFITWEPLPLLKPRDYC